MPRLSPRHREPLAVKRRIDWPAAGVFAVVGGAVSAFLAFDIHVGTHMSAGDFAVAVGTLALAGFTWRLASATRRSVIASEKSADAGQSAVDAALAGLDVDREAVEAMREQVEAIGAPYVILVSPDTSDRETFMPRAQVDGRLSLRFKLWNLGSGPAVVRDVEITDVASGSPRLEPLERYRPLPPGGSTETSVALRDWPEETSATEVTFKIRYTATSGTTYLTVGRGIASARGFESHAYDREREGQRSS